MVTTTSTWMSQGNVCSETRKGRGEYGRSDLPAYDLGWLRATAGPAL